MKRFLFVLLLPALPIAVLTLASCKKEKTPEPAYQGVTINGVAWAECNVDAPGTFAAKPEDTGMFYQWNSKKAWPAVGDVVGWDSAYPDGDTWDPDNDPCPAGWRVPTEKEQATLLNTGNVTRGWDSSRNGYSFTDKASAKSVFFPAVGRRDFKDGKLDLTGIGGGYWSDYTDYTDYDFADILYFESDYDIIGSNLRSFGYSVRCVRKP